MIKSVGVEFKEKGQIFYFPIEQFQLKKNITIIVETEQGVHFGKIVKESFEANENVLSFSGKILRIASKDDYKQYQKNIADAKKALYLSRELVKKNNLKMQIIDAYFTFDRDKLLFRFLSDNRVDFRTLVRDLASVYKTRIELRQIGARDKAREVGGCGMCGNALCCSKFLKDLDSVSINMAKNQNLSLNPNKINGVCGRLLCCLRYEDECYKECNKCLPSVGQVVQTENGSGKVIQLNVLKKSYKVDIKEVGIVEVTVHDNC